MGILLALTGTLLEEIGASLGKFAVQKRRQHFFANIHCRRAARIRFAMIALGIFLLAPWSGEW